MSNTWLYCHQKSSTKKAVVRNFAKFMEKHMCGSLFFIKVATWYWKQSPKQVFSREFWNFLLTPILQNTSGRLLLESVYPFMKNKFLLLAYYNLVKQYFQLEIPYFRIYSKSLLKLFLGCVIIENRKNEVSSENTSHIDLFLSGK